MDNVAKESKRLKMTRTLLVLLCYSEVCSTDGEGLAVAICDLRLGGDKPGNQGSFFLTRVPRAFPTNTRIQPPSPAFLQHIALLYIVHGHCRGSL
ncbi:hypothetical protein GGU10DRAFT_352500 [Lentinula aff. detonsa]|uniref:Secreted protein n=1 Tax=Lentinula aff. detonsa TaxID=2804958 RepID=A0AA38KQ72_9AGAR|nr:hypothetical protein GGU10DRAFT_352500 [Lentinula aff. detonsa]